MPALGTIRVKWNGVAAKASLRASASRGIEAMVAHAQRLCQDAVSVSGNTGTGSVSWSPGSTPRRYDHSQPGQPPRSITGKGRQSIFGVMTASTKGRVGTNVAYMAYLELGVAGGTTISATRKKCLSFGYEIGGVWGWVCRKSITQGPIAKRPWLEKTIRDNMDELRAIFQKYASGAFEAGATAKAAGAE